MWRCLHCEATSAVRQDLRKTGALGLHKRSRSSAVQIANVSHHKLDHSTTTAIHLIIRWRFQTSHSCSLQHSILVSTASDSYLVVIACQCARCISSYILNVFLKMVFIGSVHMPRMHTAIPDRFELVTFRPLKDCVPIFTLMNDVSLWETTSSDVTPLPHIGSNVSITYQAFSHRVHAMIKMIRHRLTIDEWLLKELGTIALGPQCLSNDILCPVG